MAKANEQADGHKNGETVGEVVKMGALGRRFQIGNLYDYRNDSMIAGNKLFPCFFFPIAPVRFLKFTTFFSELNHA